MRLLIKSKNGGFAHSSYNQVDINSLKNTILLPQVSEEEGEEIEVNMRVIPDDKGGRTIYG